MQTMSNQHPAFKELLTLLEQKFDLPKGCQEFTLVAKHDDVPRLTVSYVPQSED